MQADAHHEAHHELVERVVRRLARELDLSCDPEDLRAWGHQGVLEARARFDAARGVRFSTFAYYRVRGAVIDGVRKQGWLTRRAYAKLKALEASDALTEPLGEVVAQARGLADGDGSLTRRAEQLSDVLGKISAAYVLSAVGQGEQEAPPTPEQLLETEQTRDVVKAGLSKLPERERALVEAVYFDGATIEEAGGRLGLSKSWASRMHAKALERMRKSLSVSLLALALWCVFGALPARIGAQPNPRTIQSERVARLIARGESARAAGDSLSAEGYFRDAINAAPRRNEGYLALGRLYLSLDEPARALEAFESGTRSAALTPELWLGLANALERLGQGQRALAALRRLRELAPSAEGSRALASTAEAQGAFLEALSARRALLAALEEAASPELALERDHVRALELLLGGAERVRSRLQCDDPAATLVVRALARCPQ